MSKRLCAVMVGVALLFSTVSIAISADAPAPAPMNPKVKALVDTSKAAVKKVPAEAAKTAIDSKEKAVFLDVRDPAEFSAGHFPGAINISRGTLEFNVFTAIPDQNTKIYVYCKTAGRSALATKTLNDLGYKNAVLVDAQYADWVKAGYPVER
jgi:rhodanese-related sulfurtransferase